MEWLSQNWIPLAIGVIFLVLMRRGGMCCGARHREPHQVRTEEVPQKTEDRA